MSEQTSGEGACEADAAILEGTRGGSSRGRGGAEDGDGAVGDVHVLQGVHVRGEARPRRAFYDGAVGSYSLIQAGPTLSDRPVTQRTTVAERVCRFLLGVTSFAGGVFVAAVYFLVRGCA